MSAIATDHAPVAGRAIGTERRAGEADGRLTDVSFWTRRQAAAVRYHDDAPVPGWLPHVAPLLPGPGATCLEIGVVPGHNLYCMAARMGYDVTGVDFSPRIADVEAGFAARGVGGTFERADFFAWDPGRRFDIVYSLGFIEHFDDWRGVIGRHWSLVEPGGVMVLNVPLLTPVQMLARRLLYTREKLGEVLASHRLDAMDPARLTAAIGAVTGRHPDVAAYQASDGLWMKPGDAGVRRWAGPVLRFAKVAAAGLGPSAFQNRRAAALYVTAVCKPRRGLTG